MTEMFSKPPAWNANSPSTAGWGASQSVAPMTPYQPNNKPKTPSSAPQTPPQKTGLSGLLQNKRVKTTLFVGGGIALIAIVSLILISLRKKKSSTSEAREINDIVPVNEVPANKPKPQPNFKPTFKPQQVPTKPGKTGPVPSNLNTTLPSVADVDSDDEEPEVTEVTPVKNIDITPRQKPSQSNAPETPLEVSEDESEDSDDENNGLDSTVDFLNDIADTDDEDVTLEQ
jgi:hypothetical protein